MNIDQMILSFFRDEVCGILVTDISGNVVYEDSKSYLVNRKETNWQVACPAPGKDQKDEVWDLTNTLNGKTYVVTTSTFTEGDEMLQIHFLLESSNYTELYRDITGYSRILEDEKAHDSLTGLYNKGKFLSLKRTLFQNKDRIAIYNLDVNNLKLLNDNYGHKVGDLLIQKAGESLKRLEARNILGFRTGGDEFLLVALHISREEADRLRQEWEKGLAELNKLDDGVFCVMACGMAYGEKNYDLEKLLDEADKCMYENKKKRKENNLTSSYSGKIG